MVVPLDSCGGLILKDVDFIRLDLRCSQRRRSCRSEVELIDNEYRHHSNTKTETEQGLGRSRGEY